VRDDKSEMLIIYGLEKTAAADPGRTRVVSTRDQEFWLVFAGRIRYASASGAVRRQRRRRCYVAANTWHATRFFGPEPACRLSITEYVGNTLLLEPR
jgi:hypothetical protein